jgi:beta-galactosidase
MKKLLYFAFLCLNAWSLKAIGPYKIDLTTKWASPTVDVLKLGTHQSLSGSTLDANSFYMLKDGHPWYPVMGEMHYTRVPREQWEESIEKMKASGIDVIATYVFWIYHEEKEGIYSWSGDRDLRTFLSLCKKHHMFVLLRIGPWCHGEVRNGGFPDWLLSIKGGTRRNNLLYLKKVKLYFDQIAHQANGYYFKDDGPVIGIQIENEYRFNTEPGWQHMLSLKKIAIDAGMDVPFYTATGWPASKSNQNEFLTVWGCYPEAPWDKHVTQLPLSENYLFGNLLNDPAIGTDLLGKQQAQTSTKKNNFPYATAEMGGGVEDTYHRRPIITSPDVVGQAYVKVGSGANLVGYYMYHGGSNLIGKYSTLQESRATKYPNDLPIISYDFYAPLGEWADERPSYSDFKILHYFLNDFGDRLAPMHSTFSSNNVTDPANVDSLRWCVRSMGQRGFVFINNYERLCKMKDLPDVQFSLSLPDLPNFTFPVSHMDVPRNAQMVLPFNLDIEGCNLLYATAQPLCILTGKTPTYVFFAFTGVVPEFMFTRGDIKTLKVDNKKVSDALVRIEEKDPQAHEMQLSLTNGKKVNILLLSQEQARHAYKMQSGKMEWLAFYDDELIPSENNFMLHSLGDPRFSMDVYPANALSLSFENRNAEVIKKKIGLFTDYSVTLPPVNLTATAEEVTNPALYVSANKSLPENNRLTNPPASCPGPQYFVNFRPVKGSLYWKITVPDIQSMQLANAFLTLDYKGDTGSLYQNGELIADNFFAGLPMKVGLNRYAGTTEFLFQVIPYNKALKIYFQDEADAQLKVGKFARLDGVELTPQYQIRVSYK